MKKLKAVHVDRRAIVTSLFERFAALNSGTSQSRAPNQLGARLRRDAARFHRDQPEAADWAPIIDHVVAQSGLTIVHR